MNSVWIWGLNILSLDSYMQITWLANLFACKTSNNLSSSAEYSQCCYVNVGDHVNEFIDVWISEWLDFAALFPLILWVEAVHNEYVCNTSN